MHELFPMQLKDKLYHLQMTTRGADRIVESKFGVPATLGVATVTPTPCILF